MCGIAGVYAQNLTQDEANIFSQLLMLNQFRGMDSTGVFAVLDPDKKHDKPWSIYDKDCYDSTYFITTGDKGRDYLLSHVDKLALVGHCRAATVGKIEKKNAHPFDFPNIIGVHNGTMTIDLPNDKEHDTDSEALLHHINDAGVDAAFAEMDWGSAYSLVWFDKRNGTLNFLRNEKRPLWFAFGYAGTTLYWSSEKRALQFVSDVENRYDGRIDSKMWQYKPGHLITLDLTKRADKALYGREIQTKTLISTYKGSHTGARGAAAAFWPNEDLDAWDDEETTRGANSNLPFDPARTGSAVIPTSTSSKGSSTITIGHNRQSTDGSKTRKGFRQIISDDAFATVLINGCSLCGNIEDPDEEDIEYKIGWVTHDRYLCQHCLAEPTGWVSKFMCEYVNQKEKTT